jgi:hypothetical protein
VQSWPCGAALFEAEVRGCVGGLGVSRAAGWRDGHEVRVFYAVCRDSMYEMQMQMQMQEMQNPSRSTSCCGSPSPRRDRVDAFMNSAIHVARQPAQAHSHPKSPSPSQGGLSSVKPCHVGQLHLVIKSRGRGPGRNRENSTPNNGATARPAGRRP